MNVLLYFKIIYILLITENTTGCLTWETHSEVSGKFMHLPHFTQPINLPNIAASEVRHNYWCSVVRPAREFLVEVIRFTEYFA